MRARVKDTIYFIGTNPFNIPAGTEFETSPYGGSCHIITSGPFAGSAVHSGQIDFINLEPQQEGDQMFYLVVRDAKTINATQRHASLTSARDEAQRLSRKEQAKFFILAPIEEYEVEVQPVRHTILGEVRWEPASDSKLPF